MSKVRFLKVEITQNALLKTVAEVPQWEAQVLLAVWGEDAIVKGEVATTGTLPDPRDEFARLANKYGPKDDDNPFVARVYGNFGPGIVALEKEFQAATVPDDYVPTAVAKQNSVEAALRSENAALLARVTELEDAPPDVPEHPELENADKTIGVGAEFDTSSLLPPGTTVADLKVDDMSDITG